MGMKAVRVYYCCVCNRSESGERTYSLKAAKVI